jgi:hypothetical protein
MPASEERHRGQGDNPTIGLILCSEKNEAVARYSVLNESQQLFASRYRFSYRPKKTCKWSSFANEP